MPPRESRKLLFEVQEAAAAIVSFAAGKTFEDYLADRVLQSAVERQFEIMGEKLLRLAQVAGAVAARITDGQRIIRLRAELVRASGSVSERVIWDLVKLRLPVLQDEVYSLLNEP
jgi:uncharacterized protein with HEPN domain